MNGFSFIASSERPLMKTFETFISNSTAFRRGFVKAKGHKNVINFAIIKIYIYQINQDSCYENPKFCCTNFSLHLCQATAARW